MPQREPARRQTAGEPPGSKVKMRLDENGRWVPILPESAEQTPTIDAAERPPTPDAPRTDAGHEPISGEDLLEEHSARRERQRDALGRSTDRVDVEVLLADAAWQ